MSLTSHIFVAFLIVLFVLYYAVPKRFQWRILLVASVFFYGYNSPVGLASVCITIAVTYLAALSIDKSANAQKEYIKQHKEELTPDEKKAYKKKATGQRKKYVALCVIVNVALLGVIKYCSLPYFGLISAIGISFYTLQAIGYVVDVYRDAVSAEKNIFKLALFILYFPQLIQGPISRFDALGNTLYGEHKLDPDNVISGLRRILWGFFKKLAIADRIYPVVHSITTDNSTYSGGYVLVVLILYSLELYADFTGGIDIVLGVSKMFGIDVAENFRQPYFSTSLKEYWRRWHISMCSWFRDYVFYPFSTSSFMKKMNSTIKDKFGTSLGKRIPKLFSTFVVWLLTGLWHGVSLNFVVWGLLNWAVLMISEELEPAYESFHNRFKFAGSKIYAVFMMLRTFLLVCCMNLFDCYSTVTDTLRSFASIFSGKNYGIFADGFLQELGMDPKDQIVVAAGLIIMFCVSLVREKLPDSKFMTAFNLTRTKLAVCYVLFICVLIFANYGIGYNAAQFIYNRF